MNAERFLIILFLTTANLISMSAQAQSFQAEAHLQYGISQYSYDPLRDDIPGNIAKAKSMMTLFEPTGSSYAERLVRISRMERWRGNYEASKAAEREAWTIFETNFYPTASAVSDSVAYIYLLDQGMWNSKSCADANELFQLLFSRDPDDPLIYEGIPLCQLGGKGKDPDFAKRSQATKRWIDAADGKFRDIDPTKVGDTYFLWLAIKYDIIRIEYSTAVLGGAYKDYVSDLEEMRALARRLYELKPKSLAAQGILGSLIVGVSFAHQTADPSLGEAISLFEGVVRKGNFPAAYSDLALAYVVQGKYDRAYSILKGGILRYPDAGDLAEAIVAVFALRRQGMKDEDVAKLALETSKLLSRRLEKTRGLAPRDYLLLAKIYDYAGKPADARSTVAGGLAIFPTDRDLNAARAAMDGIGR